MAHEGNKIKNFHWHDFLMHNNNIVGDLVVAYWKDEHLV